MRSSQAMFFNFLSSLYPFREPAVSWSTFWPITFSLSSRKTHWALTRPCMHLFVCLFVFLSSLYVDWQENINNQTRFGFSASYIVAANQTLYITIYEACGTTIQNWKKVKFTWFESSCLAASVYSNPNACKLFKHIPM